MRCVWWGCWAPCLLATASTSTRRGGVPLTTRKKCLPVRDRVVVGVTVGCVLGSEERFTAVSGILAGRRAAAKKQSNVVVDLRDPKVREEFLMSELVKANQMLSEGIRSCTAKCLGYTPYWPRVGQANGKGLVDILT